MRPVHPRAAVVLALLSLVVCARVSRADLLVNGNFESGPPIPLLQALLVVPAGGTSLPGWTVGTGLITVITDNYWVPLSGSRSVNLSDNSTGGTSNAGGSIQQAIASDAGATYRLTFWISGEPFTAPTLKHLRVNAGPVQQDYTFDNTLAWHWDMDWRPYSLDFTANSPSSTIRFASMDVSRWGPAIDSAKVELVSAGVTGNPALSFARVSPDPVRATGRLSFALPAAGHARLTIVDLQGRALARLADNDFGPGAQSFEFSPRNWGARPGLYFAVLQAGNAVITRRFTVLH